MYVNVLLSKMKIWTNLNSRIVMAFAIVLSNLIYSAAAADMDFPITPEQQQEHNDSLLAIIGAALHIESLTGENRIEMQASAFKINPANTSQTIVAFAYDHPDSGGSEDGDSSVLIIALVDNVKKRLVAHYRGFLIQDAGLYIDKNSLRIDTAPYLLADGVRAFGVDLTSGYIPHCDEGRIGAQRTLYVRKGSKLQPVLKDLIVDYSYLVRCGYGWCSVGEPDTTIVDHYKFAIVIGDTVTNGMRDLFIIVTGVRNTSTIDDIDGVNTPIEKTFRFKLTFDGKEYRGTRALLRAFWKHFGI
ncbi:MAG TPA: hypothetical protein VHP36_05770 [Chitinispirillaceae bacterium]|nr:hypothetical protein [Chitinispirillaceae bacterium]